MFTLEMLAVFPNLQLMRMSSRPTAERQRQRCRTLTQNIHPDLCTYPAGRLGAKKSEKEKQTPGWGRLNETENRGADSTRPGINFNRSDSLAKERSGSLSKDASSNQGIRGRL